MHEETEIRRLSNGSIDLAYYDRICRSVRAQAFCGAFSGLGAVLFWPARIGMTLIQRFRNMPENTRIVPAE